MQYCPSGGLKVTRLATCVLRTHIGLFRWDDANDLKVILQSK